MVKQHYPATVKRPTKPSPHVPAAQTICFVYPNGEAVLAQVYREGHPKPHVEE